MVGSGVGVAANDWSDWRAPLTASSSSLMVPTSAEWWLVNESFVFCLRLVNRFERSATELYEPSARELPDLRIDVSGSGGLDLRPRDRSHKARTVDAVRVAIFCSKHLLLAASTSSTGDGCLPQLAADLITKEYLTAADSARIVSSREGVQIIAVKNGRFIPVTKL